VKLASVESMAKALQDGGVRYLIVGGLAVAAHGYGRVTFDVDLVIQLQPENVRRGMEALASLGYRSLAPVPVIEFADSEKRQAWIRDKHMVVFQLHSDLHPETRIDVFVAEPFDFDLEYDLALTGTLSPGLTVRFVRVETLLRMKEVADREKDREDIRQLRKLMERPEHDG
jgi:predicted nucleotidyltransferase